MTFHLQSRFLVRFVLPLALLATSRAAFPQTPNRPAPWPPQPAMSNYSYSGYRLLNDDLRYANFRHYYGSPNGTPFANGQSIETLAEIARRADAQSQSDYAASVERQRRRAQAQAEALRAELLEPQARANPDAPDQSELLKNSHDRDFILRNFRTMYVDAHAAQYFGSDQMKAALGRNKDFAKLNIRIVDDPRVADTVLKVSYTFAWDYPFALRHQNTTFVLVSGKGEGPLSGPLGAADVARQFVNSVKEWRVVKEKSDH